ncbi:hypothetical protein V494_04522 [Pseudogymnoascus sp. VKM F-4513 (FW-928)]|nr:hypothetical protein V494_04522 [Pseudogymnoascus sp. VKM F-4513 (FW-928)]
MATTMTSLAASLLSGSHAWHFAVSLSVFLFTLWLTYASLGQATAYAGTLLIWAQLIYRLRAYVNPPTSRPRQIHILRRHPSPPQKMSTRPYYQLQRPLLCNHETCWAAAAYFHRRQPKVPDGLTPFMREQWALAAPSTPQPDMEEILSTLTVTPAHHYDRFVRWSKEIWESLPGTALLLISAVLCVLVVRPAISVWKFLGAVDWPRVYVVVGMLVWVWYTSEETVERPPVQSSAIAGWPARRAGDEYRRRLSGYGYK